MPLVTLPLTFQAIGSTTFGGPFEPVTRTVASLQPDEVLVHVYAGINAMDGKIHGDTSNMFGLPLPLVVGYDFSGTVVALGIEGAYPDEDETLSVGSEVMGSTFGFGSATHTLCAHSSTRQAVVDSW